MCMCNRPIREAVNGCLLYKKAIVNSCLTISVEDQMDFLLSCPFHLVIFPWADIRIVFCALTGACENTHFFKETLKPYHHGHSSTANYGTSLGMTTATLSPHLDKKAIVHVYRLAIHPGLHAT